MKKVIHETPWMQISERTALNATTKPTKVATIDISGTIGGNFWDDDDEAVVNTAAKLKAELLAIAAIKADTIIVNIDSPGGMVSHGLSIYEMLASHPAKIITRVRGLTASIATVIAQAADEKNREVSDSALMLIHRAGFLMLGRFNTLKLQDASEALAAIDNKITQIYNRRAKDKAAIAELMDFARGEGKWISGEEAVRIGLADSVYSAHNKAVAHVADDVLKNLHLPKPKTMTNTKQSLITRLNNFITGVVKPADDATAAPEMEAPLAAELDEIRAQVEMLEQENDRLTDELLAAGGAQETAEQAATELAATRADLETNQAATVALNAQVETLTTQIETLNAERDAALAQVGALQTALAKANGRSTKPAGVVGMEGMEDVQLSPEEIALQADLLKLRAEMTVPRTDVYGDNS